MKKLKYLFLIMLSTFLSISSVDAAENEGFWAKTLLGRLANDEWQQVVELRSETNELSYTQFFDKPDLYPLWLGFYGHTSNQFTSDKIYNLTFKVDYSYYTNKYFDWQKVMQYAKMEVGVNNAVIDYCTMNVNNSTYSEFTCQFRLSSNANSSYYEVNINWYDSNLYQLGFDNLEPGYGFVLKFDLVLTSNTDYGGQVVSQNEIIIGQNEQIIQNGNATNDILKDDDVNGVENAFESFEGFISENSTITQLITMPITLYSSILNGLQSTCQPFALGNLFGANLTIPCINIGNYLGSALWSMIDIIISGFAIYSISKKLIKIFNNFSSMKEGDVIDD